jgi:hypothetical protein
VVDSLPSCFWIISKLSFSKQMSWSRSLIVDRVSSTLCPGSTRQSKTASASDGMMFSFTPPLIMVGVMVVFVLGRISSANAFVFFGYFIDYLLALSGLFSSFVKSSFKVWLIRAISVRYSLRWARRSLAVCICRVQR